jgi:hypothetical protein
LKLTKEEVTVGWGNVVKTASRARTFGGADALTKDEQESAPRTGRAPEAQVNALSDDWIQDIKGMNEWPKVKAYVSSAGYP